MRIVIIPSWYPSPESPINGVFIREQARATARRIEVTVLTPRFPSLADQVRLRWGPPLRRDDDAGVDTWRLRKLKLPTLRRFVPFISDADQVFVYYRKFAAVIRAGFARYVQERGLPDLIHAHVVFPAGWIARELGERYRVPVVLTEHSGPFAMHLATPTQRALVRDILLGVDRRIAVSAALRNDMQANCPGVAIDVVPNLVDTDFFQWRPQPASACFTFLFVGRLDEAKGVQYLLQAAATLRGRDFLLRIGGDGPHRRALERMAHDLKIEQRCRFFGMLDRGQVRAEMQTCDAFVLPSLGETFGIVVGEAMACGKPVLATRCGGPEEIVTPDTGILVAPANAAALATALASLLDRRMAFDPAGIRANVVARFGPEAFLDRIQQIYADTLANGQRKLAG